MTDNTPFIDREAWLTEAAELILDEVIMPHTELARPPVRLSVGFPGGRRSKIVAVCFARKVSTDGHNEIFVSPLVDDSAHILGALVHELIHAVDDCQHGHRHVFATLARRVGLVGPLTATTPGETLSRVLEDIREGLGPIPHAKLDMSKRSTQTTRLIKAECTNLYCRMTYRVTQVWIDKIRAADKGEKSYCPLCTEQTVIFHDGNTL